MKCKNDGLLAVIARIPMWNSPTGARAIPVVDLRFPVFGVVPRGALC
ncbi:MAG: hypothetical protein HY318_17290 [Armatimonadetes bacterium]|nr:hypothetical protein [Armatimonadota bacterium]